VKIVRLRSLSLVVGLLTLAVLVPADSAAAGEVVKDGGFESTPASEDNPNWSEGWLLFAPICDPTCTEGGEGGGTVGPHGGENWVWFGGSLQPEQQFVAQEVTIPPGSATLTFFLWLGSTSGNGLDAFRVFMDNTQLFEVVESATGYGAYKQVSLDVSEYTGTHDLSFEFEGFGGPTTNFSLDDISLQAGPVGSSAVSLKGPKKVAQGKKAKLTASIQPCAGHAGEAVDLFRGKRKVATRATGAACVAKFKVKIKRTSTFRAVSPAGASKKLKVRAG
jgi:hypothetical protein